MEEGEIFFRSFRSRLFSLHGVPRTNPKKTDAEIPTRTRPLCLSFNDGKTMATITESTNAPNTAKVPLISEIKQDGKDEDSDKVVIEDVTEQQQQTSTTTTIKISEGISDIDFSEEDKEEHGRYKFSYTPSQFVLKKDTEGKTLLKKWGFEFDMVYEEFRFDESFTKEKLKHFLLDFFNSKEVQSAVKVSSKRSGLVSMMGRATEVDSEILKTTVLNMSFFDKLKEENIIGENCYIRGCMPERYDGCEGGSLLREMFINEDSESYLAYDDDERAELLFHIM